MERVGAERADDDRRLLLAVVDQAEQVLELPQGDVGPVGLEGRLATEDRGAVVEVVVDDAGEGHHVEGVVALGDVGEVADQVTGLQRQRLGGLRRGVGCLVDDGVAGGAGGLELRFGGDGAVEAEHRVGGVGQGDPAEVGQDGQLATVAGFGGHGRPVGVVGLGDQSLDGGDRTVGHRQADDAVGPSVAGRVTQRQGRNGGVEVRGGAVDGVPGLLVARQQPIQVVLGVGVVVAQAADGEADDARHRVEVQLADGADDGPVGQARPGGGQHDLVAFVDVGVEGLLVDLVTVDDQGGLRRQDDARAKGHTGDRLDDRHGAGGLVDVADDALGDAARVDVDQLVDGAGGVVGSERRHVGDGDGCLERADGGGFAVDDEVIGGGVAHDDGRVGVGRDDGVGVATGLGVHDRAGQRLGGADEDRAADPLEGAVAEADLELHRADALAGLHVQPEGAVVPDDHEPVGDAGAEHDDVGVGAEQLEEPGEGAAGGHAVLGFVQLEGGLGGQPQGLAGEVAGGRVGGADQHRLGDLLDVDGKAVGAGVGPQEGFGGRRQGGAVGQQDRRVEGGAVGGGGEACGPGVGGLALDEDDAFGVGGAAEPALLGDLDGGVEPGGPGDTDDVDAEGLQLLLHGRADRRGTAEQHDPLDVGVGEGLADRLGQRVGAGQQRRPAGGGGPRAGREGVGEGLGGVLAAGERTGDDGGARLGCQLGDLDRGLDAGGTGDPVDVEARVGQLVLHGLVEGVDATQQDDLGRAEAVDLGDHVGADVVGGGQQQRGVVALQGAGGQRVGELGVGGDQHPVGAVVGERRAGQSQRQPGRIVGAGGQLDVEGVRHVTNCAGRGHGGQRGQQGQDQDYGNATHRIPPGRRDSGANAS